jgi:hypothetical protein
MLINYYKKKKFFSLSLIAIKKNLFFFIEFLNKMLIFICVY